MRSIAICSQKGGPGKTTIATNLAAQAVASGKRAWIFDMDPRNNSAVNWALDRAEKHPELPSVRVEPAATLREILQLLTRARAEGADFCFIDTPPDPNDEHFRSIVSAHLILIPTKPHAFDLNAITRTLRRASLEGKPGFLVFNDVEEKADVAKAMEGLKIHAKVNGEPAPMAPSVKGNALYLPHHRAFIRAAEEGCGVIETDSPKSGAVIAMRKLGDWAFAQSLKAAAPRVTLAEMGKAGRRAMEEKQ